MHAANKCWIEEPLTQSFTMFRNLHNLDTFYDEYSANCRSFDLINKIFEEKSYILKKFISTTFNGHLKALIDDDIYYNYIKNEICKFRFHSDVMLFLKNINNKFDEASKDIMYCFSYIDSFKRLKRLEPVLFRSKLITDKTISLVNFFRMIYSGEKDDLKEGKSLMEGFMTNFGMKFEEIPEGEYCHVLDI